MTLFPLEPPEPERVISVAIVDDDASVRVALRRVCEALGLRATALASGAELMEWLHAAAEPPDCVVLDTQMPRMTGLETIRGMSAAGFHVPTVVVSADDTAETRAHYIAAGVAAYLRKPVGGNELLAAIVAAVERRSD